MKLTRRKFLKAFTVLVPAVVIVPKVLFSTPKKLVSPMSSGYFGQYEGFTLHTHHDLTAIEWSNALYHEAKKQSYFQKFMDSLNDSIIITKRWSND